MRRLLLAAAALAFAGCGSSSEPSDAELVRGYVEQANAVQEQAAPLVKKANENYEAFAKRKLKGRKAELALRQTEIDLAGVQERLAALRPPPPARKLHELLLRSSFQGVALAGETRAVAVYTPRSQTALSGLNRVRRGLRDRLRGARTPARQTAALTAYARRLQTVRERLRKLDVPPVLAAPHQAQLDRLAETRGLALRLSKAIRRKDAAAVATLLKRFRAAGGPDPVADARAIGSIRAYAQRVAELERSVDAVRTEQARLLRDAD